MTRFTYRPVDLYDVRPIADILRARDISFVGASNLWDSSVYERLHGAGFDPEQSSMAAEAPDGTVAGFEAVHDDINPLRADLWGCVAEEWRDQGIGSKLIEWAIERASLNIESAPPDAQVSVASSIYAQDEAGKKLLTDHGFKYLRSFYTMKRDFTGPVEVPPLPDGFRLVSYAEKPDLQLYAQLEADSFRDHWGWIDTPIDQDITRWTHYMDTAPDFDPNYWWLAFYGEEPAGLIMTQLDSSVGEGVAWVNSLGVKREFRKRGLALAMLGHAFAAHQKRGAEAIALAVDASSLTNAVALYERAGMYVYSRRDSYEKVLREGVDLSTH
jgi:mycothiol synthase